MFCGENTTLIEGKICINKYCYSFFARTRKLVFVLAFGRILMKFGTGCLYKNWSGEVYFDSYEPSIAPEDRN
jgi:hypothetical protein